MKAIGTLKAGIVLAAVLSALLNGAPAGAQDRLNRAMGNT